MVGVAAVTLGVHSTILQQHRKGESLQETLQHPSTTKPRETLSCSHLVWICLGILRRFFSSVLCLFNANKLYYSRCWHWWQNGLPRCKIHELRRQRRKTQCCLDVWINLEQGCASRREEKGSQGAACTAEYCVNKATQYKLPFQLKLAA